MLTEKNGRDYFTPQVRSKFIEEHETCFILEMKLEIRSKKKISPQNYQACNSQL